MIKNTHKRFNPNKKDLFISIDTSGIDEEKYEVLKKYYPDDKKKD